jgi:hypothetical protein
MAGVYQTFFGAANRSVTMKLIYFSLLMVLLPLGTYYFLLHIVFQGNKHMVGWCGVAAVFVVNIIIVAYVITAWSEPDEADEYRYVDEDEKPEGDPSLTQPGLRHRSTAAEEEEDKVDRIRQKTEVGFDNAYSVPRPVGSAPRVRARVGEASLKVD